jgi:hypothetical protein
MLFQLFIILYKPLEVGDVGANTIRHMSDFKLQLYVRYTVSMLACTFCTLQYVLYIMS